MPLDKAKRFISKEDQELIENLAKKNGVTPEQAYKDSRGSALGSDHERNRRVAREMKDIIGSK